MRRRRGRFQKLHPIGFAQFAQLRRRQADFEVLKVGRIFQDVNAHLAQFLARVFYVNVGVIGHQHLGPHRFSRHFVG